MAIFHAISCICYHGLLTSHTRRGQPPTTGTAPRKSGVLWWTWMEWNGRKSLVAGFGYTSGKKKTLIRLFVSPLLTQSTDRKSSTDENFWKTSIVTILSPLRMLWPPRPFHFFPSLLLAWRFQKPSTSEKNRSQFKTRSNTAFHDSSSKRRSTVFLDKQINLLENDEQRTEPPLQRPEPILLKLRMPTDAIQSSSESNVKPGPECEEKGWTGISSSVDDGRVDSIIIRRRRPSNDSTTAAATETLSSPLLPTTTLAQHTPSSSLSSSTVPPTASSPNIPKRHYLQQTTNALHEALSDQLALMATQLKRNAQHFSASLEKDKAVIEETQEKMEGNLGLMMKEKIRLRDFRARSKGSLWMVMAIVVVVLVLFVVMVGVIRFSGRWSSSSSPLDTMGLFWVFLWRWAFHLYPTWQWECYCVSRK